MTNPSDPLTLTMRLALLSSISFGGFPTVLPDVRNFVVATHGWVTDQEFTNFFALAQAIPGPNMILMMSFIGWQVWGLPGAIASAFALHKLRAPQAPHHAPTAATGSALAEKFFQVRPAPRRQRLERQLQRRSPHFCHLRGHTSGPLSNFLLISCLCPFQKAWPHNFGAGQDDSASPTSEASTWGTHGKG